MAKMGKKHQKARESIDGSRRYDFAEAVKLALECAYAGFDESVDLAVRLGVDPRRADQMVRGTVVLPNGTGKSVRVLAFAKGEKEKEAREAGADYAGVSRLQYPSNVRIIRTMCSGRVDEKFIWNGFLIGAPVILVSGCHMGDCHYIDANRWTAKRVKKIRKKMAKLGIRPERLQLEWISAAEGVRFANVMRRMEDLRRGVSSQEISETIEILKNRKEQSE